MKSRMSRECEFKPEVREAIKERDGWSCIFCREFGYSGYEADQIAHFVPRSKGGLGVEQNGVYVCPAHHFELDNGTNRKKYMDFQREYLSGFYPDLNPRELEYSKWAGFAIS